MPCSNAVLRNILQRGVSRHVNGASITLHLQLSLSLSQPVNSDTIKRATNTANSIYLICVHYFARQIPCYVTRVLTRQCTAHRVPRSGDSAVQSVH